MSYFKLESLQHYNDSSPYLNPKDHPNEQEADEIDEAVDQDKIDDIVAAHKPINELFA